MAITFGGIGGRIGIGIIEELFADWMSLEVIDEHKFLSALWYSKCYASAFLRQLWQTNAFAACARSGAELPEM
jgi:hypothetical protein